jgi:CRISPR-associated endoribonuclease Cas6
VISLPAVITLDLVPAGELRLSAAWLHGAACALVEPSWDGEHDAQRKPFSTGPLVRTERAARWRLGWLANTAVRLSPRTVRFGPQSCRVVGCHIQDVPFASLAGTEPAWSAELEVVSPLYFARNGRDHPLPDPVLMLRCALQRWNVFAPAPFQISETVARELLGVVWLAAMDGHTVSVPVSATMHQTGYLGTVRLALGRAADVAVAGAFAALMRYAGLAGLGAQTTHGFGAVHLQRLNHTPPASRPYRSTSGRPKPAQSPQSSFRSPEGVPAINEDRN